MHKEIKKNTAGIYPGINHATLFMRIIQRWSPPKERKIKPTQTLG
jgi:hypothetical protein